MAKYSRFRSRVALPLNHSERDAEWLEGVLLQLSSGHQVKACSAYSEIYIETYDAEVIEHKRENAARFAANTRLRKFREACLTHYVNDASKAVSDNGASGFSGF